MRPRTTTTLCLHIPRAATTLTTTSASPNLLPRLQRRSLCKVGRQVWLLQPFVLFPGDPAQELSGSSASIYTHRHHSHPDLSVPSCESGAILVPSALGCGMLLTERVVFSMGTSGFSYSVACQAIAESRPMRRSCRGGIDAFRPQIHQWGSGSATGKYVMQKT